MQVPDSLLKSGIEESADDNDANKSALSGINNFKDIEKYCEGIEEEFGNISSIIPEH
jgi:hypothetical protein